MNLDRPIIGLKNNIFYHVKKHKCYQYYHVFPRKSPKTNMKITLRKYNESNIINKILITCIMCS